MIKDPIVEQAIRKHQREQESHKLQAKTLKLPCGCAFQEITEPRDQRVVCNNCHKSFYLVWQKVPKIQYEAKR